MGLTHANFAGNAYVLIKSSLENFSPRRNQGEDDQPDKLGKNKESALAKNLLHGEKHGRIKAHIIPDFDFEFFRFRGFF